MSTSQPKTLQTTTTSQSQPFGPALAGYEDLLARATGALNQTQGNTYSGDFIAGPTVDWNTGITSLRNAAPQLSVGANEIRDFGLSTLAGDYLHPESNPYIAAAGQAAIRPVQQQFTDIVLPSIRDQAISQGAYGGSGQDISEERASRDLGTITADTLAKMYAQNYQFERGMQQNAPGIIQGANQMFMLPGQANLMIDQVHRAGEQLKIDNALMKHQAAQTAPWYGLGEMGNILASMNMRETTGTQVAPNPNYVDPLTNALKMALGGGAAIAGMGGPGGFGMWGRKAA